MFIDMTTTFSMRLISKVESMAICYSKYSDYCKLQTIFVITVHMKRPFDLQLCLRGLPD